MPPEDIPEDAKQSFPCPVCGGDVTEQSGEDIGEDVRVWRCSDCSFEEVGV